MVVSQRCDFFLCPFTSPYVCPSKPQSLSLLFHEMGIIIPGLRGSQGYCALGRKAVIRTLKMVICSMTCVGRVILRPVLILTGLGCCVQQPHLEAPLCSCSPALPEAQDAHIYLWLSAAS